jgi:DNA invertase Pin-like site-specific DNA recombinase
MSNPPSKATVDALEEAKFFRAQKAAAQEKSILRMHADDVPLREIAKALNTSRSQVEKVLARGKS